MKKKFLPLGAILLTFALVGCKPSEEKLLEAQDAVVQLQTARQTAEETYHDVADTSLRADLDKLGVKVTEIEAIDFSEMSNKKIDEKLPEISEIMEEYSKIQSKLDGTFQNEQAINAEIAKNKEIQAYVLNKTGFSITSIVLHDKTTDSYSINLLGDGMMLADGYTLMGIVLEYHTDSSEWEFLVKDENDTQHTFTCESLNDISVNGVALSFEYDKDTDTGTVSFGGYFNN